MSSSEHPQAHHEAMQHRRYRQTTALWWQQSHSRAGVEGTISQAVLGVGLRETHYRGLAKTHLRHIVSAVAINLKRLFAWATRYRMRKLEFHALPH